MNNKPMRTYKIIIIIFSLLLLTACADINSLLSQKNPLVGTWQGQFGYLVFNEDNTIETLDENMENPFQDEGLLMHYESITEIEPNQLYVVAEVGEERARVPFGIFKIENGKLIIATSIEYHKSIGFIDAGFSRYEMPKDFSGTVEVYEKLK